METKETNYKSIIKTNILSFLSYGILTGFIFILLTAIIKTTLQDISNLFLSITLSLISGILLFYLIRFICKSSTIESLKNIKLSKEHSKIFLRKMNLLFILCILFSIIICISYLIIHNLLFSNAIAQAYEKYEFISHDFANQVATKINQEYHNSLSSRVLSTVIIEFSLVISFSSLIPYQKKMLTKYNKSTD